MRTCTTLLALVLGTLSPAGCRNPSEAPAPAARTQPIPMDIHSHSQPNRVRVTHVALDLELDLEERRASGAVELDLERADPEAPLVLDSMALEIQGVTGSDGEPREWELGPADANLGSPLTVRLRPGDRRVRIAYRTTEGAQAMQWLAPEQTAGGRRPFLFTQGQSILTRSWIPLQDTPGVRVTYEAKIRAPEGLTPVMSAEQLGLGTDGAWRFAMKLPIPSYLIALACGELEFRAISERCGVWAEPSVVAGAAREFEDTEKMVRAAESLFGPYRWGRYDVIILPPAFPFGGMENPRLTFATPTVLAGDKSLVALVAHELAHSWSGNLVTNATWSDFWLNEGFTVYLEQRIMERIYGAERARMEKQLALQELEQEMGELQPRDQVLHVDLRGRHPDEGFSGIPYEKGALFLRRLEEVFGRKAFDSFLARYFDAHAFQSITTAELETYLRRGLFADRPDLAAQVDVRRWLYEPGLPADAPRPRSAELERVDAQVARWTAGTSAEALDTSGWVTQQWLRFLNGLPDTLDPARMAELDRAFHFTASGNSEILAQWLELSIRRGYREADERLEEFLMNVGRRKFLKPLYSELARSEDGKRRALEIYARARPRYHSVSTGTIDKILGWGS
jgi:leukotriene-A4 hydrolase